MSYTLDRFAAESHRILAADQFPTIPATAPYFLYLPTLLSVCLTYQWPHCQDQTGQSNRRLPGVNRGSVVLPRNKNELMKAPSRLET